MRHTCSMRYVTSCFWVAELTREQEECEFTQRGELRGQANTFTDMFEEFLQTKKEKDKLKLKGYATILTNFGGLNLELHADRAPKTVYNFIKLAKQGKYDDVIFHRLIPGFMVCSLEAARN